MALKNFLGGNQDVDQKPGTRTPASSESPAALKPAASNATFIDSYTQIEGTLRCKETLRIDGQVSGQVHCEKSVLVRHGAKVTADIVAESVQISGEVSGNISARRKITLDSTARVEGDLATPGIVIEEGAKLKGRIVIGSETGRPEKAQSAAASSARPVREPELDEVSEAALV
jgi:cytoskeletal protein CcmA (bactofilin family)